MWCRGGGGATGQSGQADRDQGKVHFAYFANGGTFEWIFMEDARSFRAKLDPVERYKLRGFSVWVLGPEDPGIWDVLDRGRVTSR